MNRLSALMTGTILSAAMLLGSAAQAMQIQQFDKMADADQDEYVADLVIGAQKVLRDTGKPDLAERVHKLFTTKDPESNISIGMGEFELALAKARVADLERIAKNPNVTRIEVEHVIILTLQKNGIELPKTFMSVGNNFKPKRPLKV